MLCYTMGNHALYNLFMHNYVQMGVIMLQKDFQTLHVTETVIHFFTNDLTVVLFSAYHST